MTNNKPVVETKVQTKVKLGTKINIIIGMISALFIGAMIVNAAFLTTPYTVYQAQGETDVIAPYVSMRAPNNLQEFKIGDEITITAYAYDNSGKLKELDFFVNDLLKSSLKNLENGEHSIIWDSRLYVEGDYVIYARATDEAGNQSNLSERFDIKMK